LVIIGPHLPIVSGFNATIIHADYVIEAIIGNTHSIFLLEGTAILQLGAILQKRIVLRERVILQKRIVVLNLVILLNRTSLSIVVGLTACH
jgi:hypothetical protein